MGADFRAGLVLTNLTLGLGLRVLAYVSGFGVTSNTNAVLNLDMENTCAISKCPKYLHR